VPLDFEAAEAELGAGKAPAHDLDEYFYREWVRSLFGQAVATLRLQCAQAGKARHFALFERYDLEGPDALRPPTYGDLAREFGLPLTQVTNHLAAMRRELRRLVLEALREQCSSEEEFQAEALALRGVGRR